MCVDLLKGINMEIYKLKDAMKKYWILCLVLFVATGGSLTVLFKHRSNKIVPPSYTLSGLVTIECGHDDIPFNKESRDQVNFCASNVATYLRSEVVFNKFENEINEANVRIGDINVANSANVVSFSIEGSNEEVLINLTQKLLNLCTNKVKLTPNDYSYEFSISQTGGVKMGGFKKYLPIIALVSLLVPASVAWVLDSDIKKK